MKEKIKKYTGATLGSLILIALVVAIVMALLEVSDVKEEPTK